MENRNNWSVKILVFALIVFVIYICYAKVISDNTPPKVTCEGDKIKVSVDAKEKELLKGVTAEDDRSGDVTASLIVEKISPMVDGERIITYAAVDEKGNVGRAQRTLEYKDYEGPTFAMKGSLRFPVGQQPALLQYMKAESVLDGDISDKIKYTKDVIVDTTTPGEYEVEFRVSDSAGTVAYLPTTVEIYNPLEENISVMLKEYLVYVEKGEYFSPSTYYEGASSYGGLSIDSDVNTEETGIYHVDYTVSSGSNSGKSTLIVMVVDKMPSTAGDEEAHKE